MIRPAEPTQAQIDRPIGPPWAPFLRPKGHLSKSELRLLLLLAALPLVLMMIRVMALPGVVGISLGGPIMAVVRTIGTTLNDNVSLIAVPAGQREHVLYLLFLPTCALLIALTRLMFGIRVLGFRSILIAVGFHQSGIIPSLLLIGVAVATVALVRPWLKRIRLPLYARVSVILCIVAITMVCALLLGPWLHSELLWGVAYFPIIVLGMLAEGVAKTLDRNNMLTASWRAFTTILLAFLITIVCRVPLLRSTLLQFPELVLTQIVAVVLVSEFLDLRLFQDWDSKIEGLALPKLLSTGAGYRVVVVRNRVDTDVIGHLGRPSPKQFARRSVQKFVDALRQGGHTVKVLEGDPTLLTELRRFIPPNPMTGEPGGIVFNVAHGIQGDARYTHVPAMLEMAGVAYTGPTPLGYTLALDKAVAKNLMLQAGVPTPAFAVMTSSRDSTRGLRYPMIVKPRHEFRYRTQLVEDRHQLRVAVKEVIRRYRQEAIVEEYIAGRHIVAGMLGNDPVECLPLVEVNSKNGDKKCPARLDAALADSIRDLATATFRACSCRDYVRIDIRVADSGKPYVYEVIPVGILERRGSLALAASHAGYTYDQLLCRIVDVARSRYLTPGAKPVRIKVRKRAKVTSLLRRRKRIRKDESLTESRLVAAPLPHPPPPRDAGGVARRFPRAASSPGTSSPTASSVDWGSRTTTPSTGREETHPWTEETS